MLKNCYIGIDTSNYTTSVAVASHDGEILANLKAPLPVREGERGLRQSDAVFAHTKNLPRLLNRLGEIIEEMTPVAVAYSCRPRDYGWLRLSQKNGCGVHLGAVAFVFLGGIV